jgi:hypothetical protein
MKKIEQVVRLRKAGALVACTALMGSSSPALANGWGGNLPMAANVPIGHFPTAPTHNLAGHAGPTAGSWAGPGTGSNASVAHKSTGFLPLFGGHNTSSINSQANLWRGQAYLNSLPQTAAAVKPQSLFSASNGPVLSGPSLQLDLTSTTPSIVLGSNIFAGKQSVTIEIGGTKEVFSAGAHVTAAEYVAIRQVLGGKEQSLALSSQGAAVSGTFSVNSVSSTPIGELVVPSGVTALDYASKGNSATISGDILNYGTIYGVAARGQGTTVSINAQDIINENGGVISTVLTRSMASSVGGVMSPISLTLTATDDISNAGRIVSSGSLSLTALNGSLTNALAVGSTAGGASGAGPAPTIQASHGISLSTGTGNLTNSGLITTALGNVSINSSHAANDININGTGGTIQAVKGDITVRDASYAGAGNINLIGGNYLSNNLNLYSGTGTITGNVGQVTGKLNTDAKADHLQVATANLLLGDNTAADPTFVNSGGNIEIVGTNTFGEDVAIIASGSITAAADGQIVDHGNNVTMVAGAVITSGAGSPDTSTVQGNAVTPPVVNGATAAAVTIDTSQTNTLGGSIDLSGSKVTTVIDTSGSAIAPNAGNVTLIAIAGTPNSGIAPNGTVLLANNSTINATGSGTGNGGNVTIIGGNNTFNSSATIQTGAILTGAASAGTKGGSITLITAAPTTSDSNPITFQTNGTISSGNSFAASTTINPNAIITVDGDLVTSPAGQSGPIASVNGASAGNITITAGGSISTQNLLAFGGGGSGGDSVNLNGGAGGNGGNINVSASATQFAIVAINGQVNSSGGGGGGAGSNGATGGVGGSGGSAGSISVVQAGYAAGTALQIAGGVTAAQGGAGGKASATSVGGGGGSYGGGGGGGSNGTKGTPGTMGGAGGAGFFGGGGADLDGAGGGGGYTAGKAGGSAFTNATDGSAGAGGSGAVMTGTIPSGGLLGSAQTGGQGAGAGADGVNIPTASGGNNVTLSAFGITSIGDVISGSAVAITAGGMISFPGNVVGTQSVVINDTQGFISMATTSQSILTPSLTFNLINNPGVLTGIGTSSIPIATNAQTVTITGNTSGVYLSDSASSLKFDASGSSIATTISVVMTGQNAALDVASLPASITNLILDVGASATTGGSINFENPSVILTPGNTFGATLTANNLTWNNYLAVPLIINASNSAGSGGMIALTINETNGSNSIQIGSNATAKALSLSATASGSAAGTVGGSVSIVAPNSNLSIDGTSFSAGFTGLNPSGNGGNITLNVASLSNSGTSPLVLNASGAGTGNGGTISITTNTALDQSIGIGNLPGDIELMAANGGSVGSSTPNGGTVSFTNLNPAGKLVVDTNGLVLTSGTQVNGASITLSAGIITGPGGGQLSINADAVGSTGSANGGKLSITETANSPSPVTLGGASGNFILSAQGGLLGGNGGSVTFSTQGQLLLTTDTSGNVLGSGLGFSANVAPQFMNGNGGSLTLTAASFANANNAATTPLIFNSEGQGTGNGGHIRLNQLDPTSNLTIGTGAGDVEFNTSNGASGLFGGGVLVTIANKATNDGTAQLIVDPTAIKISTASKTNPNVAGGTIELVAPIITNANATSKTALIINASGSGKANGGVIIFEESNAMSAPTIGTKPGQFELLANAGTSGIGGAILATSGGNLTVVPAGIGVKSTGTGQGGELSLSALNLGTGSGPLAGFGNLLVTGALSVNGAGKTTGGTIDLASNSTTPFNIGLTSKNTNGVEGSLSMSGTASGGSLSVFSSGTGGIVVQSSITTPANITLTAENATAGDITINSTLGGTKTTDITLSAANTNIFGGASGKLVTNTTITSGFGTGLVTLVAGGTISGPSTTKNSVTTTKQLLLDTLFLSAISTTGDIDVNDMITGSKILTLDSFTAAGSANLTSGGGLTTEGFTGGVGNSVALSQSSISSNFSAEAQGSQATIAIAGNLNLTTGPGHVTANIDCRNLVMTDHGPVDKVLAHIAALLFTLGPVGGAIKAPGSSGMVAGMASPLASQSAPGTSASNNYTISSDGKGTVSIESDSSMDLTGKIGTTSSNISLLSSGQGASIGGTATITGKTVTIDTIAGDVGATGTGNALNVISPNLSVNTNGAGHVYLNSPSATTFGMSNSSAASFNITTTGGAKLSGLQTTGGDIDVSVGKGTATLSNFSTTFGGAININTAGTTSVNSFAGSGDIVITSGGATTVGSISTVGPIGDGSISVTNSAGALQTSDNAKIFALNGSILFENNSKSGSIVVGTGSDIETGTQPEQGSGGNVTFTIGSVPGSPVQGVAPPGVTANLVGTGAIDWGTNGISALISKLGPNTVTAKNADVIFNTGTLRATAIKLAGDVTIVADPPSASELISSTAAPASPVVAQIQTSAIGLAASSTPEQILQSFNSHTSMQVGLGDIGLNSTRLQITSTGILANNASLAFIQTELADTLRAATYTAPTGQSNDLSIHRDDENQWISETEIDSGFVPAVLFSDDNLGVNSGVSCALEYRVDCEFKERNFPEKQKHVHSKNDGDGVRLAGEISTGNTRSDVKQEVSVVHLNRGAMVFASTKPVLVITPHASINIAPRSVVLVQAGQNELAVFDFDDRHSSAVEVLVNSQLVILSPGRHILISNSIRKNFHQINTTQLIPFRKIREAVLSATPEREAKKVFTTEFEIMKALATVIPLKQICSSKNDKAQEITSKLLKTAALMSDYLKTGEIFYIAPHSEDIACR